MPSIVYSEEARIIIQNNQSLILLSGLTNSSLGLLDIVNNNALTTLADLPVLNMAGEVGVYDNDLLTSMSLKLNPLYEGSTDIILSIERNNSLETLDGLNLSMTYQDSQVLIHDNPKLIDFCAIKDWVNSGRGNDAGGFGNGFQPTWVDDPDTGLPMMNQCSK